MTAAYSVGGHSRARLVGGGCGDGGNPSGVGGRGWLVGV